jgi:23S rRNA pseudouridine2605 synthase
MSEGIRLNRYLAQSGVASRRACDQIIAEGRVSVNGNPVIAPGTRVAEDDHVKVDGRRVRPKAATTILLHKPRGLVCSKSDELGRDTIYSLLPGSHHRLNHVGRLDRDSEGLLVLTSDGDLARRLSHPSQEVEKEYLVTVGRSLDQDTIDRLVAGVYTDDGRLAAKSARRVSARRARVILTRGAKRQIRVMFSTLNFRVTKLVRVRIGSLLDDSLPPGKWRLLDAAEISSLLTNPQILRKDSRRRK